MFFTLLAGLALRLLEHSTVEKIDSAEKDQLGVVLIVLNSFIFVASVGALYLATDGGKKRFYKSMTKVTPQIVSALKAPSVPPPPPPTSKAEKAWRVEE